MEVHTHSHTPRKKWTHYFWEFLMLFLAVFCGFLAENFREHKIEKERELQFIRTLKEDLAEDTIVLSESSEGLKENVLRMDSLKNFICDPDVKKYGSEMYQLGRRASRGERLVIHDRTIQQMKNSGGFRLIRNEKVSKAIIEYYNQLGFIDMLQSIELDEVNEYRNTAITVFHPLLFDGIVRKDNTIAKPEGNPSLLTYDQAVLLRLAGLVSYLKNTRLAMAKAEGEMNASAKSLIILLNREYHLE
ncbi:MAG TPA: hypothetical protein VK492_09605 [Chitinophagaceae bacterium]|nr:hypothetical protein [Chitinophagaceae bacterium]